RCSEPLRLAWRCGRLPEMFNRRGQKGRFGFNTVIAGLAAGWVVITLAAGSIEAGPAPQSDGRNTRISFNDAIQPILPENCYACHGPDPGARQAGVRLDRGEFAYAPHQDAHEKFGPAIIPGNPDKSPMIRRIDTKNPKDRMPPPEARKTLKPEQIALLREW